MYRGFNLEIKWENEDYYNAGLALYSNNANIVQETLTNFVFADGILDGSKMKSNWFPQIEADIFISHSHNDEALAITLAGWLYETFGLKCFIDSCIWGYADDLKIYIDSQISELTRKNEIKTKEIQELKDSLNELRKQTEELKKETKNKTGLLRSKNKSKNLR